MWQAGLPEEARYLLTLYPPTAKPFAALGYKQALDYLAGRATAAEATADLQLKTRHYAKRQLTWFRADPDIHWQLDFGTSPQIFEQSVIVTERFLRRSV